MSVKIFLPQKLFYLKESCDIYGEIRINENSSVSYFVITAVSSSYLGDSTEFARKELRHLGHITEATSASNRVEIQRDVSLNFHYDEKTPNIYLKNVNIKPSGAKHANVFLYEIEKFNQLYCEPKGCQIDQATKRNSFDTEQFDDIHVLNNILDRCFKLQHKPGHNGSNASDFISLALTFPLDVTNKMFQILIECKPIVFLVKKTVFYEHYLNWKKYLKTGKRKHNIVLDRMLGICVMFVLLFYVPHPGDYLIQASQLVIRELRLLLHSLKGNPIGLKLNVHLNNFFLDCFSYHIDLWATFLNLIEPAVRQLFVPIALFGAMGLSHQLAMVSDLVAVIGLHAHCFYIYTAVLYKVEIKSLKVLWNVVLGNRRNLLKNRVESHNYMNRQLYLATIFFTTLIFLFPTILVYYVVFTTLRLCIYFVTLMLKVKRDLILEFPLEMFLKWICGNFYEINSLQLQHIKHVPSPLLQSQNNQMCMSVFGINVKSSSLGRMFSCESGVLKEFSTHEHISVSNILQKIFEGKF